MRPCLLSLYYKLLLYSLSNMSKNFFPLRGKCGEYRSRTDDPLRARQVLWPAELIPQNDRSSPERS
jgi:hypothetical protein